MDEHIDDFPQKKERSWQHSNIYIYTYVYSKASAQFTCFRKPSGENSHLSATKVLRLLLWLVSHLRHQTSHIHGWVEDVTMLQAPQKSQGEPIVMMMMNAQ